MGRESRRARSERESRAADEALLATRLRGLGVRRPIAVHENRTVLVSLGRTGALRVHRAYAYGSDRTLKAIVDFTNATTRANRLRAEKEIQTFPVDRYVTRSRPRRRRLTDPRDREIVARLNRLHQQLNTVHFEGALASVPFRISRRMRTKLGEVTVDPGSASLIEMTISRIHVERDSWDEVGKTVLHEMIHQWQAENGLVVDHGAAFRVKARKVGVAPLATRHVCDTRITE